MKDSADSTSRAAASPVPFAPRERVTLIVVTLLVVLPLYALTATYDSTQSVDPGSAAQAGWTLATTGDLAFDERWPEGAASQAVEGRDGRYYSNRFPGVIAVSTMAYGVATTVGLIDTSPVSHPRDVPYGPAGAAAVLVAALAAALTYRLIRELPVPRRTAVVAGGFIAVGTPLWSLSANALWTHGITHALLIGMVLAALRDRTFLVTLLGAAVVTVRPHLIVAVLVLAFTQSTWERRGVIAAGGAAGLALLAAYSWWIFAQPLPAAGYNVESVAEARFLTSPRLMAINILGWLIEPYSGVLVYVPIVLLALFGLRAGWTTAPHWVRVAALAGLGYAVIQVSLARATGGAIFFGHRTTIEALALAAPLLVLAVVRVWREGTVAQVLVGGTMLASVVLHGYGAVMGMSPMERQFIEEQRQQAVDDSIQAVSPIGDVRWPQSSRRA